MQYLNRENTAAAGDYLVSSGAGGVFPEGLVVGTIKEIKIADESAYAVIEPVTSIGHLKDVMVITEFTKIA